MPRHGWFMAILVTLATLTGGAVAAEPEPIVQGDLGARLDQYLHACTTSGFAGTVLVARGDDVILHQAYGLADRAMRRRASLDTMYDVGSVAKQFTGAAILRLQMDGCLHVDDPITLHLGGVVNSVTRRHSMITIRHLLTHTSGLPSHLSFENVDLRDRNATMRYIIGAPLRFMPGSRFEYNNIGYFVLAAIIESVSGQTFEQYLEEALFAPAGLEDTGFCQQRAWPRDTIATGYSGDRPTGLAVDAFFGWGHRGATGVLTTTTDLWRWIETLKRRDVLDDASTAELLRPARDDYASGWMVESRRTGRIVSHGGSTPGFESFVQWTADAGNARDDLTIIVLTNSRGLCSVLIERLQGLIDGRRTFMPPPRRDQADPDAIAGQYELDAEDGQVEVAYDEATGGIAVVISGPPADCLGVDLRRAAREGDLRDLEAVSLIIVDALFQCDYEPMRHVIAPGIPTDWPERLRDHLDTVRADAGELVSVSGLGTVPGPDGSVQSFVCLSGEDRDQVMHLVWRDRRLERVGFDVPAPVSLQLYPVGPTEYAAFDPRTEIVWRVAVEADPVGALHLTLLGPDVALHATRWP